MAEGLDIWRFDGAQWVVVIVMVATLWIFMQVMSRKGAVDADEHEQEEDALGEGEISEEEWGSRFAEAENVVKETIESLPDEVRVEARKVACGFERWPPEGYDRMTLGLFHGVEEGKVSESLGPIQIFVGGHHVMDAEGEADFAEEVRRTYLHELGHHLGLDEGEMEERGLA